MSDFVNKILSKIPFAFIKEIKQGRSVAEIMRIVLDHKDAAFVDVGCHKGEVMRIALKVAPEGDHYAYEAIPGYFDKLKEEFKNYVYLQNLAITNFKGETEFNHVESNPALSGIKERDYPKSEKITKIKVPTDTLDNLLQYAQSVDLIRIDVEGGEYNVLDGCKKTIFKHKPHILFEHQQGAADYYQSGPDKIWKILVEQMGMEINTLDGFIDKKKAFTLRHFRLLFETGQENYFIAYYKL